jgi:hypothetical protein
VTVGSFSLRATKKRKIHNYKSDIQFCHMSSGLLVGVCYIKKCSPDMGNEIYNMSFKLQGVQYAEIRGK